MTELVNVAKGARAWQSSLSKWSKPNDAARALDDDGKCDFAFHTDVEDGPWWMVDLGDQYPIHHIVIGNRRKGFQHRAKSLSVDVSRDGNNWLNVHQGRLFWTDELTLPLNGEMLARYVRLSLRDRCALHLAKVEVWTKRNALVAAARRGDGFGNRFQSLINAVYLSKALNCGLRVTWPDRIHGLTGVFTNDVRMGAKVILGHSVEPASDIFSQSFVDHHLGEDGVADGAVIARKVAQRASEILSPANHDVPGIINAPMNGLDKLLAPELAPNPEFGLPDIFDTLPFSDKMRAAIQAAKDTPLGTKSAAIHIRSGDIVYGLYRFHGRRFLKKAVPIPLAKMAIEKLTAEGYDVLLFGEDEHALTYLAEHYDVTLAGENSKSLNLTGAPRAIYDITLMSRTNTIWAADSGFARVARDISRTARFISIHDAYSLDEQARYFRTDIERNATVYDPKQAAFAIWSLYWLSDASPTERIAMLAMAEGFDPENKVYATAKASVLFSSGMDGEGNQILSDAISGGWLDRGLWDGDGRTHVLVGKYGNTFHLRDLFQPIWAAADRGVPNAAKAKLMIEEAGYRMPAHQ